MTDRVSSDHPSVRTVRAALASTATGVRLEIPSDEADAFPDGVIRLVLGGTERFARVERALAGETLVVPGVYDSPGLAREPGGEDRLESWADDNGVTAGGSVLIDVVEPDFLYGVRAPGETAVYDAKEPPSDSLSSIAESLEDGSNSSGN